MNAILMIGLGNAESRYQKTRHNIGFRVIDALRNDATRNFTMWRVEGDVTVARAVIGTITVFLLKPRTFMNESGVPVARFCRFYHIPLNKLWIVHDDVDLPFEELRLVFNRGAAGHKGVASVIENLGSSTFNRLRVGIGSNRNQGLAAEDYVLQKFTPEEESRLSGRGGVIHQAINLLITKALDAVPVKRE